MEWKHINTNGYLFKFILIKTKKYAIEKNKNIKINRQDRIKGVWQNFQRTDLKAFDTTSISDFKQYTI